MSRDCLSIEEMGALIDLEPADPALAHMLQCVRCRNLLAQLRAFRDPTGHPDPAELRRAEEELTGAFRRRLGTEREPASSNDSAQTTARPSRGRARFHLGWHPLWRPALGAAVSLIAVIGVLTVTNRGEETSPAVVRGLPGTNDELTPEPAVVTEGGEIRLAWVGISDADAYLIVFYDTSLREIHRSTRRAQPPLILEPAELASIRTPDGLALWQVVALRRGAEIARSRPAELKIP